MPGLFQCSVRTPLLLMVTSLFASTSGAEVRLDELNDCASVAALYQWVRTHEQVKPLGCQPTSSALERGLFARLGLGAANLCLLRDIPTLTLKGFSCAVESVNVGGSIFCFRGASASDIQKYKNEFDARYSSVAVKYKNAASKCNASNGDTTDAQWTLFPYALLFVSRFEFGFVTGLGTSNPPTGRLLHAYATVDPTVSGGVPTAIEVVYMLSDMAIKEDKRRVTEVGKWSVQIDHGADFVREYNKMVRSRGAPVYLDMVDYTFVGEADLRSGLSARQTLSADVAQKIVAGLQEEGFEMLSEADLQAEAGVSGREILERMESAQPYGARRGQINLGSPPSFLLNERRPQCARDRDGGLMAMTMRLPPSPVELSDYGEVWLLIVGNGRCARSIDATRRYISGLIEDTESEVMDVLSGR